jgi:septum formation protein
MTDSIPNTLDSCPPLLLASASPRRRGLLARLGLPFETTVSGVDEDAFSEPSPEGMVRELAIRKAEAVAASLAAGLVIGADTTVVLDGEWLGKPASEAEAFAMLSRLGGRLHRVYTGVAVVDASEMTTTSGVVHRDVLMRPFSDEEIRVYVATGEPMDKAGAYGIQGFGRALVASVNGCFNNVVGLPLCELARLLDLACPEFAIDPAVCRLEDGAICPNVAAMERARRG